MTTSLQHKLSWLPECTEYCGKLVQSTHWATHRRHGCSLASTQQTFMSVLSSHWEVLLSAYTTAPWLGGEVQCVLMGCNRAEEGQFQIHFHSVVETFVMQVEFQQTFIVSQPWRLEVWEQGVSRVNSSEASVWLVDGVFSCVFTWSSLCVCVSYPNFPFL